MRPQSPQAHTLNISSRKSNSYANKQTLQSSDTTSLGDSTRIFTPFFTSAGDDSLRTDPPAQHGHPDNTMLSDCTSEAPSPSKGMQPPYQLKAYPHADIRLQVESPSAQLVEYSSFPCVVCSYRGPERITKISGCKVYSWSLCLFLLTNVLLCWVPFLCDDCKDTKISCSRCGHTKDVIEKPCC